MLQKWLVPGNMYTLWQDEKGCRKKWLSVEEGTILPHLCVSLNRQKAKNKIRIRFKNRFRHLDI